MFLTQIKHLLPFGSTWSLIVDKILRQFFEGLANSFTIHKDFVDLIYFDLYPDTTREIDHFLQQFNIKAGGTDQETRDSIASAWRSLGGQGLDYLQDLIQTAGFTDVFIHQWWTDLIGGGYEIKNPNIYLKNNNPAVYQTYCLGPDSDCGSPEAGCGILLSTGDGEILVNLGPTIKIEQYQTYCLGPDSDCGSLEAGCGIYLGPKYFDKINPVPYTVTGYKYMAYVGGEIFPDFVDVPLAREFEFKKLLLTYFPKQLKIGMLIHFV